MQDIVIKKDTSIKIDENAITFLNPKYVFLPIESGFKLKVKDLDYVYKNDIVSMNNSGKMITTSISGRVLGVKDMVYFGNKTIPSLVIENDFKENKRVRKSAKKYLQYRKKEILNVLDDTSLKSKGRYLADRLRLPHKELVVNGVESEPYFQNKYFALKDNVDTILETIDLLTSEFKFEKTLLVLRNTDSEIITELMNLIGTYPNIELKLINDAYASGLPEVMKENFKLEDALVLGTEEIFDIYNVLKRAMPVTEKFITISGNAVTPSAVIKVKIGTLLSEIFISNFDFTTEEVDVYINGIMKGQLVTTLKYVVDSNIEGLVIQKKTKHTEEPCINCGQCSKNCPKKLNPKYVADHHGKVKSEYTKDCIQCGLCNHVCPSNRDLKGYMNRKEN